MKSLVILTESFPYQGGEQFIESEVHDWVNTNFDQVYVIPNCTPTEKKRYFPDKLIILDRGQGHFLPKFFMIFFVIFNTLFWKELFYLSGVKKLNIENILTLAKTIVNINFRKNQLEVSLQNMVGDIVVYSYWNDLDFYAACELKKKGIVNKVVSRAHGYDCYEERKDNDYMPLKRHYKFNADKIFLLSELAKLYYQKQYGYESHQLSVARLGVEIPLYKKNYSKEKNTIRVLSISNCIPLKRVDKIIDALNSYSYLHKVTVEWVHIGSGVLLGELKQKSDMYMQNNSYFKASFLGFLDNFKVKKHLADKTYDLFINASESEGVPVSIMEAMSYYVPVIAPDVGAISDIVTNKTGCLLSSNPTVDDFVGAIHGLWSSSMYENYRLNAYQIVSQKYNSEQNYKDFVKELYSIANE